MGLFLNGRFLHVSHLACLLNRIIQSLTTSLGERQERTTTSKEKNGTEYGIRPIDPRSTTWYKIFGTKFYALNSSQLIGSHGTLYIPYGGKEHKFNQYEVLVFMIIHKYYVKRPMCTLFREWMIKSWSSSSSADK